jgi:hypothetical protein
LPDGSDA